MIILLTLFSPPKKQGGSVPRPGRPAASMTVPLPVTVADFVNEMLRQVEKYFSENNLAYR